MIGFIIFSSPLLRASTFFQGHNLSQTAYVLDHHSCSVGLQFVACGISETLTIGTSPWLLSEYEMNNLHLKKRIDVNKTLQLSYFKTYNERTNDYLGYRVPENYKMEAWWLAGIYSFPFNEHYTLHANLNLQYYDDQTMPFSLKRPSTENSPWQVTVSTLHETNLAGPIFLMGEIGFLMPMHSQPYLHAGASLQYRRNNFESHLGFSMTSTMAALKSTTGRHDCQQAIRRKYESYKMRQEDICYALDFSIHPEFSAQYQF